MFFIIQTCMSTQKAAAAKAGLAARKKKLETQSADNDQKVEVKQAFEDEEFTGIDERDADELRRNAENLKKMFDDNKTKSSEEAYADYIRGKNATVKPMPPIFKNSNASKDQIFHAALAHSYGLKPEDIKVIINRTKFKKFYIFENPKSKKKFILFKDNFCE